MSRAFFVLFLVRAALAAPSPEADRVVVAADGTGDFRKVQAAVDFVRERSASPITIFIRKGRYEELVRIPRSKPNLRLVGEDRHAAVIAFANNDKLNPGVSNRCVVGIEADGCVLENLTVHNLTPYKGSQAEAVTIKADRCVLRHADFLSFQDTLNLNGRIYVEDCYVEGDVDYVWGRGPAVFDSCHLRTMHDGYVVQARNPADQPGFVFLDCQLTAAPETKKFYLARIDPAHFPGSHVAFVRCSLPPVVRPEGWLATGVVTVPTRFEEHAVRDLQGQPADLSGRRFGRVLTDAQAAELTVGRILGGKDGWDPKR
jgi:pectinesterase